MVELRFAGQVTLVIILGLRSNRRRGVTAFDPGALLAGWGMVELEALRHPEEGSGTVQAGTFDALGCERGGRIGGQSGIPGPPPAVHILLDPVAGAVLRELRGRSIMPPPIMPYLLFHVMFGPIPGMARPVYRSTSTWMAPLPVARSLSWP